MSEKRKQIIFDLDTKVCKDIFGDNKYRQPYDDIRHFFLKNGWMHIEGSSYMSSHDMSNIEVSLFIDTLVTEYPYLLKCVKKCINQTSAIFILSKHIFNMMELLGNFRRKQKIFPHPNTK